MDNSWLLDSFTEVNGTITSVLFDACMQEGIICSDEGSVWYVNIDDDSKAKLVSGHSSAITHVSMTTCDPSLMASVEANGSLQIWNINKVILSLGLS